MTLPSTSALLTEVGDVTDDTPHVTGRFDGEHVLVPLVTSAVPAVTDQLRVAASLARSTEGMLHVDDPTASGRTPAVYGPDLTPEEERGLLDRAVRDVSSAGSRAEPGLLSACRLVNGVLGAIERNDVDTVVVPGTSTTGVVRREVTERLALRAECDVITVNGQYGYDRVPSLLLAVAGGPHSKLATDIARRIAVDFDAWVDVLHVVESDAPDRRRKRAETRVETASARIARPERTTTWVLEAPDAAEAIIEQSAYYGLTVIGAPTKGRLRQFIAGSTNRTIRNDARSVIISTRNGR
jgi:nucleotide-binding universal stress UspA family protein